MQGCSPTVARDPQDPACSSCTVPALPAAAERSSRPSRAPRARQKDWKAGRCAGRWQGRRQGDPQAVAQGARTTKVNDQLALNTEIKITQYRRCCQRSCAHGASSPPSLGSRPGRYEAPHSSPRGTKRSGSVSVSPSGLARLPADICDLVTVRGLQGSPGLVNNPGPALRGRKWCPRNAPGMQQGGGGAGRGTKPWGPGKEHPIRRPLELPGEALCWPRSKGVRPGSLCPTPRRGDMRSVQGSVGPPARAVPLRAASPCSRDCSVTAEAFSHFSNSQCGRKCSFGVPLTLGAVRSDAHCPEQ